MTAIDIGILAILVFFLLKGILRGLLKEVCSLLGLVLGGVFAFTFYQPAAQWLQDSYDWPARLCVWGSFIAIFFVLMFLFGVVGFVLNRFVTLVFLGGFNRLAGAVFGVVQGVVVLSIILLALSSDVVPSESRAWVEESQLAPPFVVLGHAVFDGGRTLVGR
jgi:membrane protein required for colicin V production